MSRRTARSSRILALALAVAGALVVGACSDSDGEKGRAPTTEGPTTTGSGSPSTEPGTTDPTAGSTAGPGRTGGPGESFAYLPFDDCAELLDYVQTEALERVGPYGLDGGWAYGGDVVMTAGRAPASPPTTVVAAADASGVAEAAAAPGSSGTNTQEAGVDEGDLVENDGQRVYSVVDGRLRIVDVASARELASVTLPAGQHQLLLDGSRLAVTTSVWEANAETIVSVFDVADPAAPVLLGRTHLEGEATAVRAAEGTARIVLSSPFGQRLDLVHPSSGDADSEDEAEAENRRIITESSAEDWLPRSYTEAPNGSTTAPAAALDCAAVGHPAQFSGLGLVWVASVPLAGSGTGTGLTATGSAGVVSSGGIAYASPTTVYVGTTRWPEVEGDTGFSPNRPTPPATAIHSFALEGGGASYQASGQVPGTLLNQFSMSEFEGRLRVAVTEEDGGFGDTQESSVRVLTRDGDVLTEVGMVGGLGRTEQIYAVRFLGPLGYVVTFRQTDPLYVIDLHDPTAPTVTGELKIPGYSAYLHPISDTLLLGVGQDATDEGRRLGTKLSLFDVADPAAPVEVSALAVGGSSDAEFDHHAFLWWPAEAGADPMGQVVVPMARWQWNRPVEDGTAVGPELAAVVAQVGVTGIGEQGRISHQARSEARQAFPDPGLAMVQRSLVVGGRLVTVSNTGVLVSDLGSLADVAWVPFA